MCGANKVSSCSGHRIICAILQLDHSDKKIKVARIEVATIETMGVMFER